MDNDSIPKKLLFGELVKKCPFHGPKKRWRDELMDALHAISVEDDWYQLCQNHQAWSELSMCSNAIDVLAPNRGANTCAANIFSDPRTFYCVCGRHFRRLGDLTRHCAFCGATSLSLVWDDS